jgi:hypothetical protein
LGVGQLELALFLLGQRGSLVGVVLATSEHAPEQHGEFAGGPTIALSCPRRPRLRS